MTTRIVAYIPDLMDRSRVTAKRPDVYFVATLAELAGPDADLALVDISRPGVLDAVSSLTASVIGLRRSCGRRVADRRPRRRLHRGDTALQVLPPSRLG